VAEDGRPVALNVLVPSDTVANLGQHRSEGGFADIERITSEVIAIQFDEVERAEEYVVIIAPIANVVEGCDLRGSSFRMTTPTHRCPTGNYEAYPAGRASKGSRSPRPSKVPNIVHVILTYPAEKWDFGRGVVEKHESCDEGSANYRGHPKRNSRTDAGRGGFDVPDRTAPLAERKLTSFFQWPRKTDDAVRRDWQGNCELEQGFRSSAGRSVASCVCTGPAN
jgi:hypothetical protein